METADGSLTLAHPVHGETYHSHAGALAEARDLYLGASGFARRLQAGQAPVRVLDVGLGLGYNALATLEAWMVAPAPPPLGMVSLEIDAGLVADLAAGSGSWQVNWPDERLRLARALRRVDEHEWRATIAHGRAAVIADWRVYVADARSVRDLGSRFDFIWQDAFSPKVNPEMWSSEWFARLRDVAKPGCCMMTYSVAGVVKSALSQAGWRWEKVPSAHPGKRHWLTATPGQDA